MLSPLKSFVKVLKRQKFALIEEMVLSERSEFSISSIVFSKAPVSFRTLETIHREYIQKINLQKSPPKFILSSHHSPGILYSFFSNHSCTVSSETPRISAIFDPGIPVLFNTPATSFAFCSSPVSHPELYPES